MPRAAGFDGRPVKLTAWRAVEAQHLVSTRQLVDTNREQELLEEILEASKPPLTGAIANLHWLLFTPFRYAPPPGGSRFRGPDDPGVFYASDAIRTACAELGYWRWRHLLDSPQLPSIPQRQQTVFQVSCAGPAVDLREPPWDRQRSRWTNPHDYRDCQALARRARSEAIGMLRYESVRDPLHGGCVAVLDHTMFNRAKPLSQETWVLSVSRQQVSWIRSDPLRPDRFEFDAGAIKNWTRPPKRSPLDVRLSNGGPEPESP